MSAPLVRRLAAAALALTAAVPVAASLSGRAAPPAAPAHTAAAQAAAAQQVTVASLATANQTSGLVRATGQVRPVPPNGTTVYLQRWDTVAKSWAMVGAGKTASGAVTVNGYRPGSVASYRLMTPARTGYATGYSATRALTHYVWRGAFTKGLADWETEGAGHFALVSPVRARMSVRPSFWLKATPDITGCVRLSSRSENKMTTASNYFVMVFADNGQHKSWSLAQPGQVWTADLDLTGAHSMSYQASDNPNYGVDVLVDLKLLCNN